MGREIPPTGLWNTVRSNEVTFGVTRWPDSSLAEVHPERTSKSEPVAVVSGSNISVWTVSKGQTEEQLRLSPTEPEALCKRGVSFNEWGENRFNAASIRPRESVSLAEWTEETGWSGWLGFVIRSSPVNEGWNSGWIYWSQNNVRRVSNYLFPITPWS